MGVKPTSRRVSCQQDEKLFGVGTLCFCQSSCTGDSCRRNKRRGRSQLLEFHDYSTLWKSQAPEPRTINVFSSEKSGTKYPNNIRNLIFCAFITLSRHLSFWGVWDLRSCQLLQKNEKQRAQRTPQRSFKSTILASDFTLIPSERCLFHLFIKSSKKADHKLHKKICWGATQHWSWKRFYLLISHGLSLQTLHVLDLDEWIQIRLMSLHIFIS